MTLLDFARLPIPSPAALAIAAGLLAARPR